MKYQDLYRLKFSPTFDLLELVDKIRKSPSDWVMLADITYKCIDKPDLDDSINFKQVFVPQILPYSHKINNPFGRKIQHVSLQANLKIQAVMTGIEVRPDFIPFAMIAHKALLLRVLSRCSSCSEVFLELSLLLADPTYQISVHPDWLATVRLRDADQKPRARLIAKYFPSGSDYLANTEQTVVEPARRALVHSNNLCRDGFVRLYNILNQRDVLLTQSSTAEYEHCRFNYTTIAIDSDIDADYYFALPGALFSSFDMRRTFAQVVLPDHNSPAPIYTPYAEPLGVFAVKQFSSSVNFAPPFSTSSNNLLTALEIIVSCAPKSVLINSDSILGALVASGDTAESIKRQTFLTRIIEYSVERGIQIKVLGDLCQLN